MTTATKPSLSSKSIDLDGGRKVTLSRLSWRGYRAFKNELIRLESGPLLAHFSRLAIGPIIARIVEHMQEKKGDAAADMKWWTPTDTMEVMAMAGEHLKGALAAMAADLAVFIDTAGDLMIQHSLPPGFDMDTLSISDGLKLRSEAIAMADFDTIWNLEKNFLAELAGKVQSLIGSAKAQLPIGTSGSSTS